MRIAPALPLAAAVLLISTAAFADDGDPPPGPWTGIYGGLEAGMQFGSTHFALPGDTSDALKETRDNRSSFSGGGLIGLNDQVGQVVISAEGDVSSGDGTSSVTACTVPDGCFTPAHDSFTTLNHLKEDFIIRARGRLGWAFDDETMVYGSLGYSYADTKLSLVGLCYNAADPAVPLVFNFSRAENLSGINVGVGIERMFAGRFVARLEYVYDDFGNQTYPGQAPEWNTRRITISDGTVRVALAYKI